VHGEDGEDLRPGLGRIGTRIGYRIQRSDYEDFLRRRTLTGAIAAHLHKAASTAPDA
jgi:hypothetical protein